MKKFQSLRIHRFCSGVLRTIVIISVLSVPKSCQQSDTTSQSSLGSYNVSKDDAMCLQAEFSLSFAAEYSAVKNSKDFLGTAKAQLPAADQNDVSGTCDDSTNDLTLSWDDGSYELIIRFKQSSVSGWYVNLVQFKYDLRDSSVFPYATTSTGRFQTSENAEPNFASPLGSMYQCSSTSLLLRNTNDQSYVMALKFDNLQLLPFYSADMGNVSSVPVTQCIQDELPSFGNVNSMVAVTVAAVCSILALVGIVSFLVYTRVKRHLTGYDSFAGNQSDFL